MFVRMEKWNIFLKLIKSPLWLQGKRHELLSIKHVE